jgi:hypothetical protein
MSSGHGDLPGSENVIGQIEGEVHGEHEQLANEIRQRQHLNVVRRQDEMNEPTNHTEQIRQCQEQEVDRARFLSQRFATKHEARQGAADNAQTGDERTKAAVNNRVGVPTVNVVVAWARGDSSK